MSKLLIAVVAASILILSYFALRPSGANIIDSGGKANNDAKEAYNLWKDYSPESKEFHVSLPTVPNVTSQSALDNRTAKKKHYKIFLSEQLDSSLYVITAISFGPDNKPENDIHILENTVADMVAQGVNNQLKSAIETTFQGRKAVKFEIESDENHISGIAFVYKNKLYLLTRISKLDKVNEEEFNRFISSFKLNESISNGK